MGIINISDHPTLGLKRKVSWHSFIYSEKDSYVKLYTICHHFSADQEDKSKYAESFSSRAVSDFEKILIASNEKIVNPLNGVICKQIITQILDENNDPVLDEDGNPTFNSKFTDALGGDVKNPIGEFDFFQALTSKPINIQDLVNGLIIQEDQIYHSYD